MQMKPMSFGEILDGAFKIYRSHFVPMFLAALVSYAPFVLIGAIVAVMMGGSAADPVAMGLTVLISLPVMALGFGVSWGAVTHQASEAYLGRPVTLGDGVSKGFSRVLPLFVGIVLVSILAGIGLLFFVVPMFIVLAMFFAVIPVVVVENRGPIEAMGRSRRLADGAWGRILGVVMVAGLIAALPGYAISMMSAGAALASQGAEPSFAMIVGEQGLRLFLSALTTPFSMAATVLLYYDRRIRVEALDVQMMAEQVPAVAY